MVESKVTRTNVYIRRFYHSPNVTKVSLVILCLLLGLSILVSFSPGFGDPNVWIEPVKVESLEKELVEVKLAEDDEVLEYIYKSKTLTFKPQTLIENTLNPCWQDPTHHAKFSATRWRNLTNLYSGHRCLPYFYIGGFAKSATTDLWNHLTRHPQVVGLNPVGQRTTRKEIHWWTRWRFAPFRKELGYDKDSQSMNYYTHLFDKVNVHKHRCIAGDGSPDTLWELLYLSQDEELEEDMSEKSLEALRQYRITPAHVISHYTPHARYIVMMRDPTDRLYANYLYTTAPLEASREAFHRHVSTIVRKLSACFRQRGYRACLHDRQLRVEQNRAQVRVFLGMYVVMINDLLKVIPRQQVKFVNFDNYTNDTRQTVLDVCKFLNIDYTSSVLLYMDFSKYANVRPDRKKRKGEMWPQTRQLLDSFYRPFNQLLAKRLNDTGYLWESDD